MLILRFCDFEHERGGGRDRRSEIKTPPRPPTNNITVHRITVVLRVININDLLFLTADRGWYIIIYVSYIMRINTRGEINQYQPRAGGRGARKRIA